MPRPRRRFSPIWAGALIVAACARHGGARHAAAPSRSQPVDVALHVTNHHWLDMTISVEHDGQRTRIGAVTAQFIEWTLEHDLRRSSVGVF